MTRIKFDVFNLLSKRDVTRLNKILNDPHVSILKFEIRDNNAIGLRLIMQWNEFDESIPKQIEKMINLVPEEDLSKYPEIKHETKEERKRKMKEATELK